MKRELPLLLLICVVLGIGLWFGIKWFLGGTEGAADSIDAGSLTLPHAAQVAAGESLQTRTDAKPDEQQPLTESRALEPLTSGETISAQKKQDNAENVLTAVDAAGTGGASSASSASGTSGTAGTSGAIGTGTVAQSESDPSRSLALGAEEISLREKARQQRFAELGLIAEKSPEPTIALDVSLILPDECTDAAIARVPTGLKFRYESSIIRGESIIDLQSLVSLYKDCDQGEFVLDESPLGSADADDSLQQMRLNEVKYFFIQNSVPIDAVSFPEEQ